MVFIYSIFSRGITNALVAKICLLQSIAQKGKKSKKHVASLT